MQESCKSYLALDSCTNYTTLAHCLETFKLFCIIIPRSRSSTTASNCLLSIKYPTFSLHTRKGITLHLSTLNRINHFFNQSHSLHRSALIFSSSSPLELTTPSWTSLVASIWRLPTIWTDTVFRPTDQLALYNYRYYYCLVIIHVSDALGLNCEL